MRRLYLLDVLRGLASLAVVIWHYQHFYFVKDIGLPAGFERSVQPYYDYLAVFYNEGSRAVYLFFILSGFIFFFQYKDVVSDRKLDAKAFFILRFSRLYPLHFATLLFVAAIQIASFHFDGRFIVEPCNNWKRFLLNALLVSDWLPSKIGCVPFNTPTWTLSDEIFLYLSFFIAVFITPARWLIHTTVISAAFGTVVYLVGGYHLLGEPILCFFTGGVLYFIWARAATNTSIYIGLSTLMLGTIILITAGTVYTWYGSLVLDLAVYPGAILTLAAMQLQFNQLGRGARIVGDISYSTYLIHFPLQILILLSIKLGVVGQINFSSNTTWMVSLSVLITLSIASYHFFEMPVQRYIRKVLNYDQPRLSPLNKT